MKALSRLEPTQVLYTILLVFFSCLLIYCEHMFPKDGQVFQMFANVASGFAGALLAKRPSMPPDDANGGKLVPAAVLPQPLPPLPRPDSL